MKSETWLPCPIMPDCYAVSDHGRIKRTRAGKKAVVGAIVKHGINRKGYSIVWLSDNCNKKTSTVHRQVAIAFLGEPQSGYECNHKDGNKTNNNLDNLEWVSKSDNMKHAHQVLRWNPRAKLADWQVIEIRQIPEAQMPSVKILEERYRVSYKTILEIRRGRAYLWVS